MAFTLGNSDIVLSIWQHHIKFLNKTINVKEGALGRQDLKVISNLHQQCESSFNVLFQAEVNVS